MVAFNDSLSLIVRLTTKDISNVKIFCTFPLKPERYTTIDFFSQAILDLGKMVSQASLQNVPLVT